MIQQLFASDNASPVHPAVLSALSSLSRDHHWAYGDDPDTKSAERAIKELFGVDCGVYFVYNGTGANTSALAAITRSYQAVICAEIAHINEDECGASEAYGGFKLLGVHREDGKLRPEDVQRFLSRRGFEHTNQPSAVSVTQATEIGTVYNSKELGALCALAHKEEMPVHMDGARISNAAVAEYRRSGGQMPRDIPPIADPPLVDSHAARNALRSITCDAGVDILSFGATKNGLMVGEAVVFFNRDLEGPYRFMRKQATQLHSKNRYIAAQFSAILSDDLWFSNAMRANLLAERLSTGLAALPGYEVAHPTQANGVFVSVPARALQSLREEFGFYVWDPERRMARLMVSYDTDEAMVDRFIDRAATYSDD